MTASYAGDGDFNGSTDTTGVAHTVTAADTTLTVLSGTLGPDSIALNPFAASFSLTTTPPSAAPATGSVVLTWGSDSCTATLPATSCNITPTALGSQNVTAVYAANGNFNGSSDTTGISHDVVAANTSTTVTLPGTATANAALTVTVTVASTNGIETPGGTVNVSGA